jgi:ABC-type cobalamin transport system permease subunit
MVAIWPLLAGGVLDLVDLALGDIAAGPAWTSAGGMGVMTASLPTTLACLFARARHLRAHLLVGALVGGVIGGAIFTWAEATPIDPLAGGYFLLAASLTFLGACFTGVIFWLIRRPDRDAPPNPPTSTP